MPEKSTASWWVKPEQCYECGDTIGVEEPVADIFRRNSPTPRTHYLVHARHWTGDREGWLLDRLWPTLREALEAYGP